jgi:hypothetical protein
MSIPITKIYTVSQPPLGYPSGVAGLKEGFFKGESQLDQGLSDLPHTVVVSSSDTVNTAKCAKLNHVRHDFILK